MIAIQLYNLMLCPFNRSDDVLFNLIIGDNCMLVEAVQIKKFRENIIIPDNAINIVSPSSVDVSISTLFACENCIEMLNECGFRPKYKIRFFLTLVIILLILLPTWGSVLLSIASSR